MGSILSFSISSSIILACLYLAYRWTMANERQFSLNRITLYLIYAISFFSAIGLGKVADVFHHPSPSVAPIIDIEMGDITSGIIAETASQPVWLSIVLWIYTAGICIASLRFLFSLIKIARIVSKGEKMENYGNYQLIVVADSKIAPFSCLRYIVISVADYRRDNHSIIIHELTHLHANHWIDLVVANIVAIFQWFNPAAWLMIEEFKTIHEYQADDSVISSGVDLKEYQYLLIEKAVGERLPSPANSLNHSKLKKRVTMMYKSKPRTLRRVASLATIPALFAGIALVNSSAVASILSDTENADLLPSMETTDIMPTVAEDSQVISSETLSADKGTKNWVDTQVAAMKNDDSASSDASSDAVSSEAVQAMETTVSEPTAEATAQPASDEKNKKDVYVAVEEMAEFPGGQNELMKFLAMNIRYPESAMKNDIQGRVIVKFIITKTGKVEDPVVVKGVDPALDAEAIRVVKEMPNWTPGKVNGKPVDSYFNIPINFKLEGGQKNDSTANQSSDLVVVKAYK